MNLNYLNKITKILFFLCLLFSCNNKNERDRSESDLVIIDVSVDNVEKLDYKDLFSAYTAIPLETNDESLIATISKIYVTDEYIIIFDSKIATILLFLKNGNFVRRIGQKGNGPNEYLFLNDIFYDSKTQMIYAHERFQQRIFLYDLFGNFHKKTQASEYHFNSFCKSDVGFWIYSCVKPNDKEEGYNLTLLEDDLQQQKGEFFPQKEFINAVFSSTFTCDEDGIPYFFYPTSNIIYQLKQNKPKPYFRIDFGEKTMPYEKIKKLTDHKAYADLIADRKYLGAIDNFFINQTICCFTFRESGYNIPAKAYTCFITLSNNKFNIFSASSIQSFDFPVWNHPIGITSNSIIYAVYPHMYPEESITDLEKIISQKITPDMNPVLFLMDIKDASKN